MIRVRIFQDTNSFLNNHTTQQGASGKMPDINPYSLR